MRQAEFFNFSALRRFSISEAGTSVGRTSGAECKFNEAADIWYAMSDKTPHFPVEQLADLAAGRLNEAEAQPVRDHLQHCYACRKAMSRVDELQRDLLNLPQMQPQTLLESCHRQIMAAAGAMLHDDIRRQKARRQSYVRILVPLAAAAVAIIVGVTTLLVRQYTDVRATGAVVAGIVKVEGHATIDGEALTPGAQVRVGQRVITDSGGRLQLALAGGAIVELNELTSLQLLEPVSEISPTAAATGGTQRISVDHGEIYADTAALPKSASLELIAGQALVTAGRGAQLDLKVDQVPSPVARSSFADDVRGLFSSSGGYGGIVTLPLATISPPPAVKTSAPTRSRISLAVLAGPVTYRLSGSSEAVTLSSGDYLAYDPADSGESGESGDSGGTAGSGWQVRQVRAERYILWRMNGEELRRMAAPLMAQMFAGRANLLDDGRIEVRYDWSMPSQLRDWRIQNGGNNKDAAEGSEESQISVYSNALRLRAAGVGSAGDADENNSAGERVRGRTIITHAMPISGPLELSYELTTDSRQDWRAAVGLQVLRPQSAAKNQPGAGIMRAVAAIQQLSGDDSATAEMIVDADTVWSESVERIARSAVNLHGVASAGRLQLRESDRMLVDAPLPDRLARAFEASSNGADSALFGCIELQGQDIFVDNVVLRGRPQLQWLRDAIDNVLARAELNGSR